MPRGAEQHGRHMRLAAAACCMAAPCSCTCKAANVGCTPPAAHPPIRLQVPPSRWDADRGWPGEGAAPKRFGSFVEEAELFDPAFFALSPQEVRLQCGQQCL